MKRARGDDDKVAQTYETHMQAEWVAGRSLEESSTRGALAALLREFGKEKAAVALMHGHLLYLDLDVCRIGDKGAERIAKFLRHDEIVKSVWLKWCDIGSQGLKAIAQALRYNKAVELLSVTGNQFGNEFAEALIDTLNYNVCMTELRAGRRQDKTIAAELLTTLDYLLETRNKLLIPTAVRRASLCIIVAHCTRDNAGAFSGFPKEIVKMIAMQVWATRKDPIWIEVLSESERTGKSGD